jgi:hypothetical protein
MRCGWQGVQAGARKRRRIGGFGEAFARRPGLPDARSAPDEFFNGLLAQGRIVDQPSICHARRGGSPMKTSTKHSDRIREVRRIFEEYGFGNVELLEGWDGDQLEDLADFLTAEEFQTLIDDLEDSDDYGTR